MAVRMTASPRFEAAWHAASRLCAVFMLLCAGLSAAHAADRAQLLVTDEPGFGRLVLSFPDRRDLPSYTLRSENGVLAVQFAEPIDLLMPDVSTALTTYLGVARVDATGRAVRFGLRQALNINRTEAGEQLFIDLLPASWQGPPPRLPPDVQAELARRAAEAAALAEQARKAEAVLEVQPAGQLRVASSPTFTRYQFTWNVPTQTVFTQEGTQARLDFEWPVSIDLYPMQALLPAEVTAARGGLSPDGSEVVLTLAEGVVPRFFPVSDREFILDIDIPGASSAPVDLASLLPAAEPDTAVEAEAGDEGLPATEQVEIEPYVSAVGSTLRVVFPFDRDTPAAVFRRGDTVWMLFDTRTGIRPPADMAGLDQIARDFTIAPTGDTQVVRLELATDRLATLGSEGRAWVLSLGDILLSPTQALTLNRRADAQGRFEMVADLQRPGRVHQFRDPVVGDTLEVVTAFPPARGTARQFEFVDFAALRSVHGLVIKPNHTGVGVRLEERMAVIGAQGGLTVSPLNEARVFAFSETAQMRDGFVDLTTMVEDNAGTLSERENGLIAAAAQAEDEAVDRARFDLGRFYLANRLAQEALGVLGVLGQELDDETLRKRVRIAQAAANTVAGRPADALAILDVEGMSDEIDALVWRTIARTQALDFKGARQDAMSAEPVLDNYPAWVRGQFYLAAARSALEMDDLAMATRLLALTDGRGLEADQRSEHALLGGRLAEAKGSFDEALDIYGQVISADIRPTRAEAVYRTLAILNQRGTIDLPKAAETLAAEAMLWRGNPLEASMQKLLAEIYFRMGDYRLGLETVKQAVAYYPESQPINALRDQAQAVFSDLYLNGGADALPPVEALSIFYDFRHLTPAGAQGDEMIRNLVRRLVKVDLLEQAASLLDYQIDNRLTGVARAQVATDLAVIEIANRRPDAAIRALGRTRLANLPPSLDRQRRLLEARALIDAGRDELAVDLLSRLEGRDVEQLRVDAHWAGKRYDEGARLLEAMYSPLAGAPLDTVGRINVVKAAVGYVLANDMVGLSRLRSKFGDRLATTPEWPLFDYVTGRVMPQSLEFRKVARQVAGVDELNAFLASYRQLYEPGGSLVPLSAAPAGGSV